MDTAKLLMQLSAVCGTPGMENEACEMAAKLLAPYGQLSATPLGGVTCTVRPPEKGGVHVLLDAHIDEIGMVVTYITEDGFLRVAPAGGIDRRLLLASPVLVHTQGGVCNGVVCSVPPHLQSGEEKKNQKVEGIYIDVGMPKERCEQRIMPGDRVTIQSRSREMLNGQVSGKALDNRASCVALLHALKCLDEVPCGLTVQFSSMEEVGGMGAKVGAYQADPTHAIVLDVSFAHTPDADRERCGLLQAGPMIGFAPILDHAMSQRLVALATERGIPFQREAMGGRTGTNADSIVTSRAGIKTALLSIPQKYMHTPIEVVSVEDVEHAGRLVAAMVCDLAKGGKE